MIGLGSKKGVMMSKAGPNHGKAQTRKTGPSHGKAGAGREGRGLSRSGDGGRRRQRRRNGNRTGDRRGGWLYGGKEEKENEKLALDKRGKENKKNKKARQWDYIKGEKRKVPSIWAAKGIGQHEWGRCPIAKVQEDWQRKGRQALQP